MNQTTKKFTISKGNKKLSKKIHIFNLPAITTCLGCGACAKYCYAMKAQRLYTDCRLAREKNLEYSKTAEFVKAISDYIQTNKVQVLRIHESGDFYSLEYFNKWVEIANTNPNTIFYTYTKSFEIVDLLNLPKNLVIIQSFGSRYDNLINPNLGTCRVIETPSELMKGEKLCPSNKQWLNDGNKCGETCTMCQIKNAKIAILKH